MLNRALASSRYIIFIPVVCTLLGALALILYMTAVVADGVTQVVEAGPVSSQSAKVLAVGLLEAVDVFLIAIVAYIISLGLYALFIDDKLPLPRWLEIHDLEDLKNHLVGVVIAVLAVLFLREAVARAADLDLLSLGGSLALMIGALTFFLIIKRPPPKE